MELMDLALSEVDLLNSPIEEEDRVASSLQLRRPVTNFCPPAGGVSAEAAGCELPDSFWLTTWWWTRATRTKTSATTNSTSAMLTELVLAIIIQISPKRKNKYLVLFLPLIYCTGRRREKFTKSHSKEAVRKKVAEQLGRLQGSPRQQHRLRGEQQVEGGCQIGARPQCKAWPWPKAKT